jgi:hypothetical protein
VNELIVPAATLRGSVRPVIEKPAPVTLLCEIFRVALPGFEIVIVWVFVEPTVTLPKATVPGCSESCG